MVQPSTLPSKILLNWGLFVINVFVVDDHDLVRMGITRMLADVSGIDVIGEASSGEEALKSLKDLKVDVVLMDAKCGVDLFGTNS